MCKVTPCTLSTGLIIKKPLSVWERGFCLILFLDVYVVMSVKQTGPSKLTSFLQEEQQEEQQEKLFGLICLFIDIKIPNPNDAVKLKFI